MQRTIFFLILLCFTQVSLAYENTVSAKVPAEEATISVVVHSAGANESEVILAMKKLVDSFGQAAKESGNVEIVMCSFRSVHESPERKKLSSAADSVFEGAIVIQLDHESSDRFWMNAMLMSQIFRTLEQFKEENKHLTVSWSDASYQVKDEEVLRESLYGRVSDRIKKILGTFPTTDQESIEYEIIYGEMEKTSGGMQILEYALPFELNLMRTTP